MPTSWPQTVPHGVSKEKMPRPDPSPGYAGSVTVVVIACSSAGRSSRPDSNAW